MAFTITQTNPSALRIEADAPLVSLSADDVERLIAELAKFRRNMTPEVSRKLPDGEHGGGTVDPSFLVQTFVDQKFLALRDPGIGWVMFLLPEAEHRNSGMASFKKYPVRLIGLGRPAATKKKDRDHARLLRRFD